MINTPGTHLVSEQAVWRSSWPAATPLQFPRPGSIAQPRPTLEPGVNPQASPAPSPDNAEPRATSSSRPRNPMKQFWELSDSD